MKNRAFGDNSPGRPRKRVSSTVAELCKYTIPVYRLFSTDGTHRSPIPSPFPSHDFIPSLFVQKVVNMHHHLNMFLRRFPSLAHKRVVKLLWRRVLPFRPAVRAGNTGDFAIGW